MNKEITIIDLLNKIANNEEVPEKIHIKNFQSDFIFNGYIYLSDEKEPHNIFWYLHSGALNYKVEIIEEENKIEKIPYKFSLGYIDCNINESAQEEINKTINDIYDKINELIDEVNKLKEEK